MVRSYRSADLTPIWVIIGLALMVFVASLLRPDIISLLGVQRASLAARPWTMVTSMFTHAGFGHIFTNMLTLYFFGSYLIQLIGGRNFLIVYFAGGILGNILFLLLSPALAIGASGAVFAVGGALTVLQPKLRVFIFPIPVPIPLWVAVIGGFLIMLLPGIAWQAHLGGLVLGLVAGYFFRRRERRRAGWRW